MFVFEYILLSAALALPMLMTMRDCADKVPVRLSRGLLYALAIAIEQVCLILIGKLVGGFLRFDMPEYDNLIFLGLLIVVALRLLFAAMRREKGKDAAVFDISRWGTVLLMGLATGTNALFVGLGLGFKASADGDTLAVAIPLVVLDFLFCYWGLMLGRQHKTVRRRRWLLIAALFLLLTAIKGVVDA